MLWQRQPPGQERDALGDEALIERSGIRDAIDTEIAKVVSQLTPRAEHCGVDILGHCDRTNGPMRVTALLIDIGYRHLACFVDRSFMVIPPMSQHPLAPEILW